MNSFQHIFLVNWSMVPEESQQVVITKVGCTWTLIIEQLKSTSTTELDFEMMLRKTSIPQSNTETQLDDALTLPEE